MNWVTWVQRIASHRKAATLLALVTTFGGVALLIDRPKGSVFEWLALPLLVAGGSVFAWAVWPHSQTLPPAPPSLARKFLMRITGDGRFVRFFPSIGVGLILADIAYNVRLSGSMNLGTEDTILILGAIAIIAYRFVPGRFARERDFVLLFFLALNAILVAPLLVARAYYNDFGQSVDVYSWTALAPQTGALLRVVGVSNSVQPVAGSTAPGLTFTPQKFSVPVTVVITTSCSGIYSFGIFAAAFVSFVLTEYERPVVRVWLLLGLGLVTAYVANILRMVVIVLVGYYTDTQQTDLQNMLIAHSYAGWAIFLSWIALFWGVLFGVLPRETGEQAAARPKVLRLKGVACTICGEELTPLIPATRCLCGVYSHQSCIASEGACPACGLSTTFLSRAPQSGRASQ